MSLGGGPWRLVEASGELGYEEALSRGTVVDGGRFLWGDQSE